jgi:hypothetical protein
MKIEPIRTELRAKISEAVKAGVQALREESAVSPGSRLGPMRVKRADFGETASDKRARAYQSFRRKLLHRRHWRDFVELLAEDRFNDLWEREIRRSLKYSVDPSQIPLPGFENMPRNIRSGRSLVPLQQITVGKFLRSAELYEKRMKKNTARRQEFARLAGLIRNQPHELSVPEAVARALAFPVEGVN